MDQPPCPRCGQPPSWAGVGRKPLWCSQRCRRAAYEERRAAAAGAIAVRLVEREKPAPPRKEAVVEPITRCVQRVLDSPRACREVVHELTRLVGVGAIESNQHKPTLRALEELVYALDRNRLLN